MHLLPLPSFPFFLSFVFSSFPSSHATLPSPPPRKYNKQVMSERSKSEDIVSAYTTYQEHSSDLQAAEELMRESGDDPEMREMAREEVKLMETQMAELEEKIKVLLLPKDPNDDRNVMLEIRAGTGGSEANIFAGDLYDVYRKYASSQGWRVKVMDESQGDDGGFKNICLEVSGDSVYSKLKW